MTEAKIKEVGKIYGLFPALIRQIQVKEVQSVALYDDEIWWRNQKNDQNKGQKLINQQACLITGIYPSIPISAFMGNSG